MDTYITVGILSQETVKKVQIDTKVRQQNKNIT